MGCCIAVNSDRVYTPIEVGDPVKVARKGLPYRIMYMRTQRLYKVLQIGTRGDYVKVCQKRPFWVATKYLRHTAMSVEYENSREEIYDALEQFREDRKNLKAAAKK